MVLKKQTIKIDRFLPWILIITGVIGLICSFVLAHDQIRIWQDPSYIPACNLNPVVSCGSVINSKQGHIFGIPGPFYGFILFPVLATIGIVSRVGSKLPRWFWLALTGGAFVGFLYASWLFFISVYKVHALCPFCLITDVVVYLAFWYITLFVIQQNYIVLPKAFSAFKSFIFRHHLDILLLWYVVIIIFILHHFWYYYGKHI